MKKTFFVVMVFLFSFVTAQEKKQKSCTGGCCSGEIMAMTQMQTQHQFSHSKQKNDSTAKMEEEHSTAKYSCSMHPEVKSAEPGNCPKCGMELVAIKMEKKSSGNSIMKEKMQLMKVGKYQCCIEDACDMCVKHGGCFCKKAVKNNKPVCGECYEGWKEGHGNVSGKTLKDIKKEDSH